MTENQEPVFLPQDIFLHLISQGEAGSALDCGDYANEAMERVISELLIVLAAGKACLENTQQGHSWDEDHGGGSCRVLGPELLEGIWG